MTENLNPEHVKKIEQIIHSRPVALFMKGSPEFPMCGFSARAFQVLELAGVRRDQVEHFDILSDRPLFETLRKWANWPTSPQVYFKGKLIGGCDVVTEMYENGELKELVKEIL